MARWAEMEGSALALQAWTPLLNHVCIAGDANASFEETWVLEQRAEHVQCPPDPVRHVWNVAWAEKRCHLEDKHLAVCRHLHHTVVPIPNKNSFVVQLVPGGSQAPSFDATRSSKRMRTLGLARLTRTEKWQLQGAPEELLADSVACRPGTVASTPSQAPPAWRSYHLHLPGE